MNLLVFLFAIRDKGVMKFAAIFGVLMIGSVFGNGGGYFRNGVERMGSITGFEPENTEKIAMVDEKLTVLLGIESAKVEIVYLLKNVTDDKVTVRFGFPVEETRRRALYTIYSLEEEENARLAKAAENGPVYSKDYRVVDGGKDVPAVWKSEPVKADGGFEGISGWLVSEVKFSAGEEKVLRISFVSEYTQGRSSVSDDTWDDEGVFKYRLSTAACWAGPIKTGRIVFKADGVHPDEVRVIKPVNRFKKEGDDWVWSFEDLEPSLQDDIEVEAVPSVHVTKAHVDGQTHKTYENATPVMKRGESWFARHANYKVKASSVLPDEGEFSYSPENLKTVRNDECWAEGAEGNGVGEWLEFLVEVPRPLHGIFITPGYYRHSKEMLFKANARPKSLKVTLNGEHEFIAELKDSMTEQMIAVSGYTKSVKTVRLTVMDVYPGSAYEDLCISSVSVLAKLNKEPELQQAR